jgi:hypothetical protein
MMAPVETTVTIIATPAEHPDSFEEMRLAERREQSGGWKTFPVRSGRYLDTFVMKATDADFSVFGSSIVLTDEDGTKVETMMICDADIGHVIEDLAALVEQNPEQTAKALVAHGGGSASIEAVVAALKSGAWPDDGDAATEAAAFAHHLLSYARVAKGDATGVCWEYRGPVSV